MKQTIFDKKFIKSYKLRILHNQKLSKKYDEKFLQFCNGKRGNPINDHALIGQKSGLRAFSVTSDIRIVYKETEDSYIFLDIGSHNQVY